MSEVNENVEREALIEALLSGGGSLERVRKRLGVTMGELCELVEKHGGVGLMEALCRVMDMYGQMVLRRERLGAIRKLGEHARQRKDVELSRKACVDLTKVTIVPFEQKQVCAEVDEGVSHLDSETVQAFMKLIGGEKDKFEVGE